jgi:hypothetical protein
MSLVEKKGGESLMTFEDRKLKPLGVRPAIKTGESLSSFILRLCQKNKISLQKMLMIINNQRIPKKNEFQIDIFPRGVLDIKNFAVITGIEGNSLCSQSYGVIYEKIFDDKTSKKVRSFKLDLNKLLITDRRRYCTECLFESNYFKLYWQVRDIGYCLKHQRQLAESCSVCGNFQPYLNESLIHKVCNHCGSLLTLGQKSKRIKGGNSSSDQLIKEWLYLLNPSLPLITPIRQLNREKSIALTLLYIQSENKKNQVFTRNVKSGFRSLIREMQKQRSVLVSDMLRLSNAIKVPVNELLSLKVPFDYEPLLASFKDSNSDLEVCSSPWCKDRGSNKAIEKVVSNYKRLKDKYEKLSVCTSCYIRYAYNKVSLRWEDVENQIGLVENVIPLLTEGSSIRRIEKLAGAKAYPTIGYILYHRLITPMRIKTFKIDNIPIDKPDYFYEIFESSKSMYFMNLFKSAKELFGWEKVDLAYYLATPSVQNELNFSNQIHKKSYYEGKSKVKKQVDQIKTKLLTENDSFTLSEVASSLDKDSSILRHYSLNKDISKEIIVQKEKQKIMQLEKMAAKVNNYFLSQQSNQSQKLKIIDAYKHLDVNRSYVRRNHLSLDHLISKRVEEHNKKAAELRMEEMTTAAVIAVENLWSSGERVTMENIGREIGIPASTLYSYQKVQKEISKWKARRDI